MNDRYIYDEKTSSLYAPNGKFLKKLYCPKAMNWNQLVAYDGEERWRGCGFCQENVINLDNVTYKDAKKMLNNDDEWSSVCVYVPKNSEKIIFLKDDNAPPHPDNTKITKGRVTIRTVRTIEDIQRAVSMGYWVDVRLISYNSNLRSNIIVSQDPTTGEVSIEKDCWGYRRFLINHSNNVDMNENIRANFYQYYQQSPIAAYLIPKWIRDGTLVTIPDPIEDYEGHTYGSDDIVERAYNLSGVIRDRRVFIDSNIEVIHHISVG